MSTSRMIHLAVSCLGVALVSNPTRVAGFSHLSATQRRAPRLPRLHMMASNGDGGKGSTAGKGFGAAPPPAATPAKPAATARDSFTSVASDRDTPSAYPKISAGAKEALDEMRAKSVQKRVEQVSLFSSAPVRGETKARRPPPTPLSPTHHSLPTDRA